MGFRCQMECCGDQPVLRGRGIKMAQRSVWLRVSNGIHIGIWAGFKKIQQVYASIFYNFSKQQNYVNRSRANSDSAPVGGKPLNLSGFVRIAT